MNMAGKLLVSCLRNVRNVPIARMSGHEPPPYSFTLKAGNREVVGYGVNGEASYIDHEAWPMPAVRFKEITPDLAILKEKEKGDWKKLTLEEKKTLYRASFCQTFAEMDAPTGEWKSITGITLTLITTALWIYVGMKLFVYEPLPDSFKEENRLAQLERMIALDVEPITGGLKRKKA
ncbi:cytochrome c oxidase subunit 4 isoform 1, mitochondrial-like [Venturia canescens]|uniref:cytochrome c oxidase subunit 4 isoform 1, mitochondrial-like n=1 Tax=Venturia canescens TaxID=32260 RepID=UPI001C9CADF9|nr:cytochrome c oxidase subunit 4 isoform 1, mitochondrial-like [Venturia canescens]XP_043286899.1 cytochrome c oxidase subunit 4 isoform 1, mitochondrial-like [Venturia canescens]